VVLLPGREDKEVWDYFASLAFPAEHLVRQTLRVLAEEGRRCRPPRWSRG
jgi:ATP-dependent DNA helicase RecQ